MPIPGRRTLEDFASHAATPWTLGIAAGVVAGAVAYTLRRTGDTGEARSRALEDGVVQVLLRDPVLGSRDIEVGAMGDGIIELVGSVRTEDESRRAIELTQDLPGVTTVLNRLDVGILERHLEDTRARERAGDPALHGQQWYGMRVGTGSRRQAHETDPDRPDDRVPRLTDELGVDRAQEQMSEPIDKMAPGTASGTSGNAAPTDRGTVDDASHRRLGNVPEEDNQDLNPLSGVHENVKEGTDLTLERSGLKRALHRERERRRRSEERS